MGIIVLPIGSIFRFNGNRISDHNRSDLGVDPERIEKRNRMANGMLRTFVVSTKRTWKCSWENIPRQDNKTVDGFWGQKSLEDFYLSSPGAFTLTLTHGDNTTDTFTVMFKSFTSTIASRSSYTDLYNVDLTLEEV